MAPATMQSHVVGVGPAQALDQFLLVSGLALILALNALILVPKYALSCARCSSFSPNSVISVAKRFNQAVLQRLPEHFLFLYQ
ncbi:MAG: hypothetical protein ACREQ8_02965 [Woeseiaceae bacterium]